MPESVVRTLSGSLYILLLVASIFYSENSYKGVFIAFMLIGCYEFCKMISLSKTIALSIGVLFALISFFTPIPYQIFSLLCVPFLIYISYLLFFQKPFEIHKKISKIIYLLGYVILPFLCITQLIFYKGAYEPKVVLGYLILIWTNDTFAYICGKSLGKHKLFEKISPKKTIEGFIGGVLFSIIAAIIIHKYLIEISVVHWVMSSLIISFLGTVGDLIESKFKRQAGIKDSGSLIPGHGGILDRLDSFIFAAPFLLLIYNLILYVS